MKYFFNTENGQSHLDTDGTELPNDAEACVEAARVLSDLLRDKPREFCEQDDFAIKVTDATGLVLFTMNLSRTLSPAMQGRKGR